MLGGVHAQDAASVSSSQVSDAASVSSWMLHLSPHLKFRRILPHNLAGALSVPTLHSSLGKIYDTVRTVERQCQVEPQEPKLRAPSAQSSRQARPLSYQVHHKHLEFRFSDDKVFVWIEYFRGQGMCMDGATGHTHYTLHLLTPHTATTTTSHRAY